MVQVHLLRALQELPQCPGEEVVVVAECQDMPATDGYEPAGVRHQIVLACDGTRITSLRQLAEQLVSYGGYRTQQQAGKGKGRGRTAAVAESGPGGRAGDGDGDESDGDGGERLVRLSLGSRMILVLPYDQAMADTRQILLVSAACGAYGAWYNLLVVYLHGTP